MANKWSFLVAQEHMPHVVRPSDWAASSRNGGLGGGGTKFPLNNPLSEASNDNGELKLLSSRPALPTIHQVSSLNEINESSDKDGDMLLHLLRQWET